MGFTERYAELEAKFRQQVVDDWQHGIGSLYWPVIPPKGPVDYVLISMEPSDRQKHGEPTVNDQKSVPPYNQAAGTENYLFNHCVREYLCQGNETYHLTDLAKGALSVKRAKINAEAKYERWYPLLEKELQLVWKPGKTRIIAVGRTPQSFLRDKRLCERLDRVLHYNPQGVGWAKRKSRQWEDEFEDFDRGIRGEEFEESVRALLKDVESPERIDEIVNVGGGGSRCKLTPGRRWLMFYYKNRFNEIRESRDSILWLNKSRFYDNPFQPPNAPPKLLAWYEKRDEAIRIWRETGDDSMAIEIGLFPSPEEEAQLEREELGGLS